MESKVGKTAAKPKRGLWVLESDWGDFGDRWDDFLLNSLDFPVEVTGFVNRWDGRHEVVPFAEDAPWKVVKRLMEGRDEVSFRFGWDDVDGCGDLKLVWSHHDASGSTLIIRREDGSRISPEGLFGEDARFFF